MEPEGSLPCSQEPATFPILSQMNPIHISKPYFLKIHLNVVLPSTPKVFLVVSSLHASQPKCCMHPSPPHARHMPRPSHPPCLKTSHI
jgi:hypothetical protein